MFDAFIGSGDHPRPLLNVFWKSQFLPYFSLYGPIRALKGLCSTRYWYQAVHLHPKYVPGRILGKCKVSKRSQMVQSKKLERELGHMGGVIALPSRRSENNDIFTFGPKIGHFWGVAAAASGRIWPENRVFGAFVGSNPIFQMFCGGKNLRDLRECEFWKLPVWTFFFHYISRNPPIWARPS